MTSVIGISALFHDSAVALVRDGEVVFAMAEERLTRVKHDSSFPRRALELAVNLASEPIEAVVFYERPDLKARRVIDAGIMGGLRALPAMARAATTARYGLRLEEHIVRAVHCRPSKIHYVEHHMAHASSAFYSGPDRPGALLTVDGVGELATACIGRKGPNGDPELVAQLDFPHSLGLLYSSLTEFLGFEANEGEFKVMGLAAYGSPTFLDGLHSMARLHADGSLDLDLRYFRFQESSGVAFSSAMEDLLKLGRRRPDLPWNLKFGERTRDSDYADLARSLQVFAEEAVLRMGREAHRVSGASTLGYAGGVALNGLANERLLQEGPFERITIPPAPGDDGAALGAAYYGYFVIAGGAPASAPSQLNPHLGLDHGPVATKSAFGRAGMECQRFEPDDLVDEVVARLARGEIVGWHQGRDEFGPRALGARSILADPGTLQMKDRVNATIKFRENFRPFAPVVNAEQSASYFSDPPAGRPSARYMSFVTELSAFGRKSIPAVDHAGTTRAQVVEESWNPILASLLDKFGRETGVNALLNTSFNLKGEAIVASPDDAISTFQRCSLDCLVIGNYVATKF